MKKTKLKLELYKPYRTRGGKKVVLVEHNPDQVFPFSGVLCVSNRALNLRTWRDDGSFNLIINKSDKDDIVGEWVEPLEFDWDCLPGWCDKAIAMDSNGMWLCSSKTRPTKLNMCWGVGLSAAARIPPEYAPKNFNGSWEDSLFINPKYQDQ